MAFSHLELLWWCGSCWRLVILAGEARRGAQMTTGILRVWCGMVNEWTRASRGPMRAWTEGLDVDSPRLECGCGMMMCTQVQGSVEAELGGWQRAVEYKRDEASKKAGASRSMQQWR